VGFSHILLSHPFTGYRYIASHTKGKGIDRSPAVRVAACEVEVSTAEDTETGVTFEKRKVNFIEIF
jgi:hypothetical protein